MSKPRITSVLVQMAPPAERKRKDWGPPIEVAIWRDGSPLPDQVRFDSASKAFSAAVEALLDMTLPEETET